MVTEPTDNPYVRDPETDFEPVAALDESAAREQAEVLREAIEYHDHRYYVANDPLIADREYDALFDRLVELEDAFDLDVENSPTQRVGGEPLDELPTREHVREMLSLDSSGEETDVREFDRRVRDAVGDVTYSMEPKFDGFSVEIVYEDGAFDRAVTRGNGREGEDVSANVKTIRSVPLHLPDHAPEELALRGEIYMPRTGFLDLNERRLAEGKDAFANPRNAAAGSVRLLDPSTVADRPLDVFFYDVMDGTESFDSQTEVFAFMDDLGLRTTDWNEVGEDVDAFLDYREAVAEARDDLEFELDGVVAKVDDVAKRAELGVTARHPKWAFAYKFPAKTGETTVRKIVVQVGRTGKLTPVALLDPVDVRGVTISRATLHNESQIRDLGVTEGATVTIERAGDVIPEVAEVLDGGDGDFEMPDHCPACDSEVVQEGEHHFCTGGTACPAQLKRAVGHFCSRGAMDVEGVGERVATQLVESGLVTDLADLYELEKADLTDLEGFGERSAEKLLAELDASKDPVLADFLFALGIRHVGKERARTLAGEFTWAELQDASVEELLSVPDVGPEVAESIHSFFASESNRETIRHLETAGVEPRRRERSAELDGQTFVITGSIEGYTRGELTDLLESNGANVTSSVSGNTDYLVVGENPGSTKLDDAEEHGVETLDPDEFEARVLSRVT
ncbi:NAD-dependent DNA ligase LigA [Haloarculaceae archaeon H-GB2-1]|nr:NAD-dependent DNA ligase LigA [Haloarculaceae archaeon H-GB1-1]MEA5386690.1 NAD-dependent DNA ligase LigA [Haloarculaceae archaeon H-GB11]MEA5408216.1 NAD-dependent DNA ligase LigA [Haloarculaceae archaeon H-GB2-1]